MDKSKKGSDIIYTEVINKNENNMHENKDIKKIGLKSLFKLGLFIIISIMVYIILAIINVKLINYLGETYLLNVNNARLIVSISSLLGMFIFIILANESINKIIKYLIIYDLQKTGINLLTLNKISEKNIITTIIHILKNKNIRWFAPIILLILTFFNNLFFSRIINIYTNNKQISTIIDLPKYTNYEQIQNTNEKIKQLKNGDTSYVIGDTPNTITFINDTNVISSVNNNLLLNFINFDILDNITLPFFTSNCISPQYIWKKDVIDNINNITANIKLINNYTNNEFHMEENINLNLSDNGISMSIVDIIYNSSLSSNRFLLTNIIALRINGDYILNGNSSIIYGMTIQCYTIVEFILAKIFINGTTIHKNNINVKDNGLNSLSTYGMINTVNALLRDNILDVHYKPGPITKSLFLTNSNNLIEDINPNISQTISKLYALLWPKDSFPNFMSNGLGFQNQIISISELNITLLIIWICIWFILIIFSCLSIYNLLNIEHNQIALFKYKEDNNKKLYKDTIICFVENKEKKLFYKSK